MTVEQAAMFKTSFRIYVRAEAVQTENVGDNAEAAFETIYG